MSTTTMMDPTTVPWFAHFRPDRRVDVVTWMTESVRLPEGGAGAGGKWRRDVLPYVPGILTACADQATSRVTIKKSVQAGLTTSLLGFCGYTLATRHRPLLWVAPTTQQVQAFAKGPVADLLRRCPPLAGITNAPRKHGEPGSSLLTKLTPSGAAWHFAGGNSPNSYAALSVAVTVLDDADRVPAAVSEEGDPVHLLTARTTAWPRPLSIFNSTPVLASGRVSTLYAQSDRRKFHVPCPRCGRSDFITWSDHEHWAVVWDERNPRSARLRHECGLEVPERGRMALIRTGEWRATAEPLVPGHVGFEITSMLSPFLSLTELVEKFLTAHGTGPRALREFITLHLAEGWKDPAITVDVNALVARLEEF